jgi:hypothetical protein
MVLAMLLSEIDDLHLNQLTLVKRSVKLFGSYVCGVTVRMLPTVGVPTADSDIGVTGFVSTVTAALAGAIESVENNPTLMTPVRAALKTLFTIFL